MIKVKRGHATVCICVYGPRKKKKKWNNSKEVSQTSFFLLHYSCYPFYSCTLCNSYKVMVAFMGSYCVSCEFMPLVPPSGRIIHIDSVYKCYYRTIIHIASWNVALLSPYCYLQAGLIMIKDERRYQSRSHCVI